MKRFITTILSFALVVGMGNSLAYANTIEPLNLNYGNRMVRPKARRVQSNVTFNRSSNDASDGPIWDTTVCVASIGMVLASTLLPLWKIAKIKEAIKIVGGLTTFAELLIGLILGTQSLEIIGKAFGALVLEAFVIVMGIDDVIDNCKL